MACKFIYKNGRVFKSELDLDEFILNSLRYTDNITDEVFDSGTQQKECFEKFISVVKTNRDIVKYSKLQDLLLNPDSEIYFDYEKLMPKGTIPVTGALKEYRDAEGYRLFKEFISENYWRDMIVKWQSLKYWHDTSSDGPSQDFITAVFGEGKTREDITSLPTSEMMTRGRHIITNAWAMQGFIGTGIHRMFKAYWDSSWQSGASEESIKSAMRDTITKRDLVKGDDIPDELKKFKGYKFSDIINPDLVNTAYDICVELRERLNKEFGVKPGEKLFTLAEVPMVSNFLGDNGNSNLLGSLDLVVIDPKGNIHILDYKTSPHPYSKFDPEKKNTFKYQLATYQRMVQQRGFNIDENSGAYVIPIQFTGFKMNWQQNPDENPTGAVSFDSFKLNEDDTLVKLKFDDRVKVNMENFLKISEEKPFVEGEILQGVKDFTDHKFPVFNQAEEISDEDIVKNLQKKGDDKPKNKVYSTWHNGEVLKADSLEGLIEKIKEQNTLIGGIKITETRTKHIKFLIKHANDPDPSDPKKKKGIDPKEIKSPVLIGLLDRYANGDWEIVDNYSESLDALGIILLRNKYKDGRIDVLVCDTSTRYLTDGQYLGGNRETLTGSFIPDITEKNHPNSQVMTSTYGNIRLMQTMAALNQIPSLLKGGIGDVTIFNSVHNQGLSAPNTQLLYNFDRLCQLDKAHPTKNNFREDAEHQIRMFSYLDLVKTRAQEILLSDDNKWYGIKGALDISEEMNTAKMRAKLEKLAEEIENQYNLQNTTRQDKLKDYQLEAYRFLAQINFAIAELSGATLRQQLQDHSSYMNQKGVFGFLTKGWSANMLDNPGMLDSDTLNLVGTQLNVAYQNVRDEVQNISKKLDALDIKLKEHKGFGYIKSRTFGNEALLYKNMYDESYKDDLVFKNPFEEGNGLDDVEREYLKFALLKINNNRLEYPITDMEVLKSAIEGNRLKYLRVPLMTGSTASKFTSQGILETIKQKFLSIIPGTAEFKRALNEKMNHIFTDTEIFQSNPDEDGGDKLKADFIKSTRNKKKELWYMSSIFDYNEQDDIREHNLAKNGVDYYERNLSILVREHCFSYSLKNHINKVFPVLKACAFKLEMEGALLDRDFVQDLDYLHKFITAKVLNKSIEDPKWKGFSYLTGEGMKIASKLALAFNPRQLYQAIDGLFKDISLVYRNPDGSDVFTAKNFRDSFIWAYTELTKFGDKKSMIRTLNELYGINDMDMNQYAKKIRPNQYGVFNFDNLLFHFASRPDFYNRMTIFGAKMRADGCFEAHDDEGNYDWTKDKRYEIFAKYCKDESKIPSNLKQEYQKQKALYTVTAEQFVAEGAKYEKDGELVDFVLDLENPVPLPRAYTVREAESIKSMADLVYGYYSHEKKSLIQSTTVGALFMQMNTYWSSKKNQYMAPGGIRMLGRWEQLQEVNQDTGEMELFYEDENGCPTTDKSSGIPYIVWRGQYQEGILVTLSKILETAKGDGGWAALFNPLKIHNARVKLMEEADLNMRTAYRNNIRQFWIDLLAYLILGMFISKQLQDAAKQHAKDTGNDTIGKALGNFALINGAAMLHSACLDFNALDSIAGRAATINVFAPKILEQTVDSISHAISGDRDLYDTLFKISAARRAFEPVFDYIKQQTLGRPMGDNGKD